MRKAISATIFFLATLFFLPGISIPSERLCVQKDKINVRSGPGTNYDVLWQTEKYYPLEIMSNTGKWAHFKDFEGYEGWAYKPLLGKEKTVVTKANKSNIRKGPGTQYDILFTAEKGVPFLVLETKKDWYKIQHSDGDTGWIFKSLIW